MDKSARHSRDSCSASASPYHTQHSHAYPCQRVRECVLSVQVYFWRTAPPSVPPHPSPSPTPFHFTLTCCSQVAMPAKIVDCTGGGVGRTFSVKRIIHFSARGCGGVGSGARGRVGGVGGGGCLGGGVSTSPQLNQFMSFVWRTPIFIVSAFMMMS